MKRLWKLASAVIALLVVGLIAVIAAIFLLMDPNQFKPLIISQFKQFTGFEIQIPGKLSWALYPHLGMEAEEVVVSNPPLFSSTMKHLTMRMKLGPLLHRQLELSKVSIEQLQFNQLQATNIKAKIRFKDRTLQIQPVTADFYQSDLRNATSVSFAQSPPGLHMTGELKNINMAALLNDLLGKNPAKLTFDARGNISVDLQTRGKESEELLKHLNGSSRFSLEKGVLKGVDIGFFVDTAMALINKQPLPTRSALNQTDFGQLSGTAQIKNGIAYNDDLVMEAPLYTVKGKGSINLMDKTLDYHLEVNVKVSSNNKIAAALVGQAVPISVSGSLDNPRVALDTLALMRTIGKEQLQEIGTQIQKALPEKANKFIQGLFH